MSEGPTSDVDGPIWELHFPQWLDVSGRVSVADLVPKTHRCGVYVLGFANGDRYVGQSLDVAKRFAQHRLNHSDITMFTFRGMPKADLSRIERGVHPLARGQQGAVAELGTHECGAR